jgi:transcriptional regulator with XRE-family HTH domain
MSEQAEKLKQLMEENHISVLEFSNCIGISEQQVIAYCEGAKKLSNPLQRQIEQTFSKPANWLNSEDDADGPNYDLFG